MLNPDQFDLVTFDCYGTLIDWESGIVAALEPLLRSRGIAASRSRLLKLYSDLESPIQQAKYRPYKDVLTILVRQLGAHLGFEPTEDEAACLVRSLPGWQPFPDTVESLRCLAARFRLGVLSNVDDDLFEHTAAKLGVELDLVVTAQQVGSYKPHLNHFRSAIDRAGVAPDQILHVAESLFHDVVPAQELGITAVWVNRSAGKVSASRTASVRPDTEVPDLRSLTHALGLTCE